MIDRKTTQILLAALVLFASMALVIQSPWDDSEAAGATGISLNESNITIRAGDDVTLVATVTPAGGTDTVTWSSSKSLIVSVDQGGKLTPKAYGKATITAAVGGVSASCTVNVEYSDMAVSPASLTLIQGNSGSLALTLPDGYSNVVWRTSSGSVATVSGSGASATVRGVGVGQATITAICGNLYMTTCAVTVTEKPPTVSTYTFLLKMDMDASLADVGTSGLTAEDLESGITFTGQGYNAGAALESALMSEGIPCSFWSGASGGQDLLYWVDSIMGLGDVHYANGDWKYWIQYHYSGGKYVYNDLTLGHYTDGGRFKIVYGITSDPGMSNEAAVPSPVSGLVYNGKTQTGVPSGEGYTITGNTATNAGTYSAVLTLKSGYTWEGGATGTKTVSWSISKAVLTARYVGETITEGSAPAYRVTVTGFVNGESASTASNYVAPRVVNSDLSVGSHTLAPSGGSAKNYSFQYSSGVLTVVSLSIAYVPSPSVLTYNGQTQTGVPSGTGYSVSGGSAKDVGTYTARLTLSSGYKWADGTTAAKTVRWTISKAVLTASYAGETITEGSTPAYRVVVTGFVNGESASTASNYVKPRVVNSDLSVGSHTLAPSGGSAKNYSFRYVSGVLTVTAPPEAAVGDRFAVGPLMYEVSSLDPASASLVGYAGAVSDVSVPSSVSYFGKDFPVDSVGEKAFYNCATLASVDLGPVRTVGMKAFANCSRLGTLVVPETVKTIGAYAFYGCGIITLDIPGDDVVLEASAFSACKKMSDITFSGHGAVIGQNAFYKNNGVTSVDLSTVASIGTKAFPYCDGMESLTIPGSLSAVGSYAFYKCANLKTLVVEEGVKKVLTSAFSGCVALENVSLPVSLTYLGDNAFYGLKFTDADGDVIDPTAKNLRGHAFAGSDRVLAMADKVWDGMEFSVNGISYAVASAASRTVSATGYEGAVSAVPSSVEYDGFSYTVTSIGDSAFLRCASLTSADLSNVKALGFKALGNCAGITEMTFGDSLESIGGYALYGLSFYDGDTKLKATPDNLKGRTFAGEGAVLYLVS